MHRTGHRGVPAAGRHSYRGSLSSLKTMAVMNAGKNITSVSCCHRPKSDCGTSKQNQCGGAESRVNRYLAVMHIAHASSRACRDFPVHVFCTQELPVWCTYCCCCSGRLGLVCNRLPVPARIVESAQESACRLADVIMPCWSLRVRKLVAWPASNAHAPAHSIRCQGNT